jgi:hypothetical protein
MPYNTPPSFAHGEHLSAYKLRILAGNDDYFSGAADRYESPVPTFEGGAYGAIVRYHFFQGNFYHVPGRNSLFWEYDWDDVVDPFYNPTIYLTIDKGLASEIAVSTQTVTGTYSNAAGGTDISALAEGLHTVELLGGWDYFGGTWPCPRAVLKHCYEAYSGALVYGVPHSFPDGQISEVADFQHLVDNDLYFRATEPGNHPFFHLGMTANAGNCPVWRTWFKHRTACPRMYYKNSLTTFNIIVGDPTEVGLHEHVTLTGVAAQTPPLPGNEGYHNLVGAFVDGAWYEISGPDMGGWTISPDYLGFGRIPGSVISGFAPSGEFSPGAFVWGDTATQGTRLELLKSNDVSIQARLNPTDYQGRHHAVGARPGGDEGASKDYPGCYYYFKHLLPVLSYTGAGVVMTWETDNSITLPTPVSLGKIDLSSVSDLQVGQMYKITGAGWAYEGVS